MILHLVTDRRRLSPACGDADAVERLVVHARSAIDAGVDVIQVRERDLETRALFTLTQRLVASARGSATRVVVNDRVDVALAARADGVHLRARSLTVAAVRRLAPRGFLVGRSVHDQAELESAAGADYAIVGTVWPTSSKPESRQWLGIAGLAAIVSRASMPVLAIGGVTADRLSAVARSGVSGIAAIEFFMGELSAEGARTLSDRVRAARRVFDSSVPRS